MILRGGGHGKLAPKYLLVKIGKYFVHTWYRVFVCSVGPISYLLAFTMAPGNSSSGGGSSSVAVVVDSICQVTFNFEHSSGSSRSSSSIMLIVVVVSRMT